MTVTRYNKGQFAYELLLLPLLAPLGTLPRCDR
jgi:hypothetical protein